MLYFAYIDTLDEPFVQAHLRHDEDVVGFSFSVAAGEQVANLEFRVRNQGLAMLAPGRPQYLLMSWSPDGTIANAIGIARGRIVQMPETMTNGGSVTYIAECAPRYAKEIVNAAAAALNQRPYADMLFGDVSRDRMAEAVMAGRSERWLLDPFTHEPRRIGLVGGARVVDIGENYDARSLSISRGEMPAAKIRMKLVAEWTQHAYGLTNIASFLNSPNGSVTTLNTDHIQHAGRDLPGQTADLTASPGWTMDRNEIAGSTGQTLPFRTGRVLRLTFETFREYDDFEHNKVGWYSDGPTGMFYRDEEEMISLPLVYYWYNYAFARYEYSQQRRETATLTLSIGNQDINYRAPAEVVDLGEVRLGDLLGFEDLVGAVQPYDAGRVPPQSSGVFVNGELVPGTDYMGSVAPGVIPYHTNDRVIYQGKVYRLTSEPPKPLFNWKTRSFTSDLFGVSKVDTYNDTNWEDTGLKAPLEEWADSFFDTVRGREAIEHGLLRLRAALLDRQRYWKATVSVPFGQGVGLTMDDLVRIVVRSGDGVQPVRGKVVGIKHEWSSEAVARTSVTIAIPVGDGITVEAPEALGDAYCDARYCEPDYIAQGDGENFVVGDIAYNVLASERLAPVDARRLADPNYAVTMVSHENMHGVQLAAAQAAVARGEDPTTAIKKCPTKVRIQLRPLYSVGVIEAAYQVEGQVLFSPRGINLTNPGAEP